MARRPGGDRMIDDNYIEMPAGDYTTAVDALAAAVNKPGVWLPVVNMVGITINLTKLPCWKEYQRARDRHNCGPFKKRLRRTFCPSLARRYGREFVEAQGKLQGEFLAAVIDGGGE